MREGNIKIEKLSIGNQIDFQPGDPTYGKAEFVVCPVFRHGIMRELYIDPQQQPQYFGVIFAIDLKQMPIRTLHLTGYPSMKNDPRVWRTYWCKEHRCFSLEMYAGGISNCLKVTTTFGDSINLEFRNR